MMEETLILTNDRAVSSGKVLWAGRIMSGIAIIFVLFDSALKLLRLDPAVKGTVQLEYPESVVLGIGIIQFICLLL